MIDGTYSLQYSGAGGRGAGVVEIRDGRIFGTDTFGSKIRGTYVPRVDRARNVASLQVEFQPAVVRA